MRLPRRRKADQQLSAMATVTACHYEFGAGQALAFGIPVSKHFHITFNYWANGTLHTGEFDSAKAVPQGTLFPITYNADAPHENSKSHGTKAPRWYAFALVGAVIFLAASTTLMRGCASFR